MVDERSTNWMTLWKRHWLLVALILHSGLAYCWPDDLSVDPFSVSTEGLQALVVITMFCLGLVVRIEELAELRKNPLAVFLGVAVQCTLMPFLAWIAINLLQLEGDIALGVILVGCVPGAMASNVLTMTARGNVSYSVSLTSVATLLSPLTVPLALSIIGGINSETTLNPVEQSKLLLITVVLPVVLGFGVKQIVPTIGNISARVAPLIASIALLLIIASVVAGNRQRLSQIRAMMLFALLSINLLGYVGGYLTGRIGSLPESMKRALSLEVGMQNAGLGTFLAGSLFGDDSLAQIPTAAYTFGCMLTGTILASLWASFSHTAKVKAKSS